MFPPRFAKPVKPPCPKIRSSFIRTGHAVNESSRADLLISTRKTSGLCSQGILLQRLTRTFIILLLVLLPSMTVREANRNRLSLQITINAAFATPVAETDSFVALLGAEEVERMAGMANLPLAALMSAFSCGAGSAALV